MKVGIVGASGYAGETLVKLLLRHPQVQLAAVTAIAGQDLASRSPFEAAALLFGPVGQTKLVTFGTAATLSNMSVPILVDETLPLPAGTKG